MSEYELGHSQMRADLYLKACTVLGISPVLTKKNAAQSNDNNEEPRENTRRPGSDELEVAHMIEDLPRPVRLCVLTLIQTLHQQQNS